MPDADIQQMEFIDLKLRSMIYWLESRTGFKFTMTSMRRIGDPGVHGTSPLRGIDLRCRSLAVGAAIEDLINDSWFYDSKRPELKCCKLHGEGPNLHLHLQVHPNTSFIE